MTDSVPELQLFESGPLWRRGASVPLSGRIAIAVLLTWGPMAVLAGFRGPFFRDAGMYARFLVAIPILILGSKACGDRLRLIAGHFVESGVVPEPQRERFDGIVASRMRLADSMLSEFVLLVLVGLWAVLFVKVALPSLPATWRTIGSEGNRSLSPSGWWLALVAEPIYDFLVLRLLYRVALWWSFLARISRLPLRLNASHPDGAGGIGFLHLSLAPFAVPVLALSASMAGALANVLIWTGRSIRAYEYEVLAFVVFVVALFAGPLVFFVGRLAEARRRGTLSYGSLSGEQFRQFEEKWLPARRSADLLGASDFSAVIDLHSTVAEGHRMRNLPFQTRDLVPLILCALAPFLPLLAQKIPMEEVLKVLVNLLM